MRLSRLQAVPLFIIVASLSLAWTPPIHAEDESVSDPAHKNENIPSGNPAWLIVEEVIQGPVPEGGAAISNPCGLAVDRHGRILLADTGNDRLIVFDREGNYLRLLGGPGTDEGRLSDPNYITFDQDWFLWVADHGNQRIARFKENLMFHDTLDLRDEEEPLKIGHPVGLAVNEFGELWLSERDNDQVVLLDNLGRYSGAVGGYDDPGGALRNPAEVLIGPDEYLYVCDPGNSRVAVYDNEGVFAAEYLGALESPVAGAFDSEARFWVLDQSLGRLFVYDPEGYRVASILPTMSGGESGLVLPNDIAFDLSGRLLISDAGSNRLLICRIEFSK